MSRRQQVPRRLRRLFKAAGEQGWETAFTKRGHPALRVPAGTLFPDGTPCGALITFASTPSDHRGDLNAIARLRRLGLDVSKDLLDT